MTIRERFRRWRGEAKEALGLGGSPSQSTSSLPKTQTNPTPSLPQTHFQPSNTPPGALTSQSHIASQTISPRAGSTWKSFSGFQQAVNAISGGLGPLKSVLAEFAGFVDMYEGEVQARRDYAALKGKLEELFGELTAHFSENAPPTMTGGMNNLCAAIEGELDRVSSREERGLGRRLLEARKDLDEVMECYRRIQGHLERFRLNADLNMWKIVDKLACEGYLKSLTPSMSACYNSTEALQVGRRECTPETRKQVLAGLDDWRHDKNKDNLYWLNGMAGTGKTTIASSLCVMLDQSHELGASFFCTRLLPECRNVKLILPTIAYQLARYSRPFYHALSLALQADPDLHTKALPIQLQDLIVNPLREASCALPEDLVVVIDALDECEDSQGVGLLLESLARQAPDLPLKIFVSSRPEPQIRRKIGDTRAKLILHELEESIVKDDIKLYLQTEFKVLSTSVSDKEFAILVERAGVLFIYAATVVRYIQSAASASGQRNRIDAVLDMTSVGSKKDQAIDALYSAILSSTFDDSNLDDDEKSRMRLVLDTVVCAREPLTVEALAKLLQLKEVGLVQDALDPLWSVVHISGTNSVATTLHASFPDYMLDLSRSKEHGCHSEEHHGQLAELCFDRIGNNEKQFNICDLESSYVYDEQVQDLAERVKHAIADDLSYACRYWAVHLMLGMPSLERIQRTHKLVANQLLLWIEVLNLKKQMNIGAMMLETAKKCCMKVDGCEATSALVHDAWRFVTMFASNDISRSTAHLYTSMLASWPSSEPLSNYYMKRVDGLSRVEGTGKTRRQLALLSVFDAEGGVNSVCLSPDGTRIASGLSDGTVRVWSILTGKSVLDPLEGHTSSVNSVAFSPDGMRIVSGSDDNTIRVWDAQTGKPVLEPLKGHTMSVYSVAFSPDGMRIVSGSDDHTIRVWDAQNGQPVLDPLKGHTSLVMSVTFSLDGMRIVSGSHDKTIRVWDAQTGQPMLEPLEGHASSVYSVAVSPDGMRIVSGSDDSTIRVWDAQTGQPVLEPLEGHTSSVYSVAFSPDGMRIVSGSDDHTIRVWDAQTGQPVLEPLEGHTGSVLSVAFSPDGTRIVSGSHDNTVRVWDAQTGQPALEPLEGHAISVYSVAFSPDGMRIVSGSYGDTIRVWDAQTGQPVLEPLEGHTSLARSVAFSPDGMRWVPSSLDSTIRVWDAQTGQPVLDPLKGHTSSVNSVAFSPDGMRIVSGSDDNTIRVWDTQTGQPVLEPLEGHTSSVSSVAFSSDGKRIVSGSHDGTVRVWDAQTGQPMFEPLEGHTSFVRSVAFSPDGMRIASSSDKTIRVWDVPTGQPVIDPTEGDTNSVSSATSSPKGTQSTRGASDNMIRIWNADTPSAKFDLTSQSPHSLSHPWRLSPHGWVVDTQGRLLLWLPPDLRDRLILPNMSLLISPKGFIKLDFSSAKIGESWRECYTPHPRA